MKEFVDLASVYLSLGSGFVVLWFSLYGGYSPMDSIVRALTAGVAFFCFGIVLKLLVVLITAIGGGGGRGTRADAPGGDAGQGGPEETVND